MSAPAHGAPEASGSRAFTPRTETSINSNDSESTAIRKTVRKWYDAAKMPTIYHRKSFGSFGNIEPLHPTNTPRPSEAPPTSPPRHQEAKDMDTNAVGWDHEGDPQNPMNWSKWRKGAHFLVVFLICFVSPFTSSVFAPAINYMMEDFGEVDIYLSAFVISIYVLGYAVGPLIIGPLSEVYGRLVMYHVCNVIFTVFTTLCGITQNLKMLAILRFFAGCGGASAFALGPATVSDLVPFERHGGMYAVLGIAYNLGPAVSPLVGSDLHDALGWRWIFWLTGILGGVCTVATFTLSETYEPVLLRRKAYRLRKERHNPNLYSVLDSNRSVSSTRILVGAMLRPLRMLLLLPNVFLVSLLTAVGYGYMYILYTTLPSIFLGIYDWEPKQIGLAYLGTAIGNILGMICGGPLSDFIVKRHAARGDMRPENRLIPMIFLWPLVTAGFIVFAWTAEKECAWYWPLIGTAIFGMGAMSAILFCGTYVVDAYTVHSASAAAATTVLRSLLGGLVPLFTNKMYAELGVGWMFTTLGLAALVFWPIPYYFYKYGNKPRQPTGASRAA